MDPSARALLAAEVDPSALEVLLAIRTRIGLIQVAYRYIRGQEQTLPSSLLSAAPGFSARSLNTWASVKLIRPSMPAAAWVCPFGDFESFSKSHHPSGLRHVSLRLPAGHLAHTNSFSGCTPSHTAERVPKLVRVNRKFLEALWILRPRICA